MRFDLSPPLGTCYLAESALGAFVESFQDIGSLIPLEEIESRRISELFVPTSKLLADCTDPLAHAHGVTGGIHTWTDRKITRAWANSFQGGGFAGIRYFAQHDPSHSEIVIALFGDHGETNWPIYQTTAIGPDLLKQANTKFGIVVATSP